MSTAGCPNSSDLNTAGFPRASLHLRPQNAGFPRASAYLISRYWISLGSAACPISQCWISLFFAISKLLDPRVLLQDAGFP